MTQSGFERVLDNSKRKRNDIIVSHLEDSFTKSGSEYAKIFADENSIYADSAVSKGRLEEFLNSVTGVKALVFLDDFAGSGDSICKNLKEINETIGSFISSKKIMNVFQQNPVLGHITTFGGNAVCCAAGLASLQEIIEKKLYADVERKAQLFIELLQHKSIQKIHHCGLLMAVYLDNFDNLWKTIQVCLQNGLVTDWFLFANNCMRIAPPLIITDEEIKTAATIIHQALDKVYNA